jgi:predicted RecB family endonuclease
MISKDKLEKLVDEIAYLQKDNAKVGVLVDRLDIAIDKLTEVSTSVSKLLAVHEMKISSNDEQLRETMSLVEKRRHEMEIKLETLQNKIALSEKESFNKIEENNKEIIESLKELRAESLQQHQHLDERISRMEKWMWTVIGGSVVLGFLISYIFA